MFSGFFAQNLKRIRKSQGMTQAQLAQQLFLSTQAISKWERGESTPDINHIYELTRIFGVSSDALLGIQGQLQPALLGVDGGGTKTEFVLITPEGKLLKRLVLGGSNPNNATPEGSFRVLCQGIDQILQTGHPLLGIFIGCSGMASGNNAATVTALLKKQYPHIPLRCQSDIMNVFACADDPNNAICVICGTGSVVYATTGGELIRAGGSGWRLDGSGSGYELGRRALLAALDHRDGTGEETLLAQLVETQLGGTVWDKIPEIYAMEPAGVAAFAPLVLKAWQAGDPVAARIVDDNCSRVAQLIISICKRAPSSTQVMLTGSILVNSQSFRQLLTGKLPQHLRPDVFPYPQVWGACMQCARLCRLDAPDFTIFNKDYAQEVAQC